MRAKIAAAGIVGLAAIGMPYSLSRAQEAPSTSRSVWDGVYTQEQAERGHSLYHENCAKCHGDSLDGGDEAPALADGQFRLNWNGLTLGDLFDRMRKSMPQDNPGHLSAAVNADILSYLLVSNGFPAGKTELPQESEILRQIRFESTKPDSKNGK